MTEQSGSELHLWEMNTLWFIKPDNEFTSNNFFYKSWKEFVDVKPYKLWKPYVLSSWCWKKDIQYEQLLEAKSSCFKSEGHTHDVSTALRTNLSRYDKEIKIINPGESKEMLQIVFISPSRFRGMNRAEILITEDDEEAVKAWIKNHMPTFWKI